jgi:hypothetical protein
MVAGTSDSRHQKILVRGHVFQAGGQRGSRPADSASFTVSTGSG